MSEPAAIPAERVNPLRGAAYELNRMADQLRQANHRADAEGASARRLRVELADARRLLAEAELRLRVETAALRAAGRLEKSGKST